MWIAYYLRMKKEKWFNKKKLIWISPESFELIEKNKKIVEEPIWKVLNRLLGIKQEESE